MLDLYSLSDIDDSSNNGLYGASSPFDSQADVVESAFSGSFYNGTIRNTNFHIYGEVWPRGNGYPGPVIRGGGIGIGIRF